MKINIKINENVYVVVIWYNFIWKGIGVLMFFNVCINYFFIMIIIFWVVLEVGGYFFVLV